jgi:nucleoside-diphosphate-sugar epimerase
MRKAVISGGTGFVGSALARRLASCGHDVVVLTRDAARANSNEPGVRVVEVGLQPDPVRLAKILRGSQVVYNLAGTEGAVRSNRAPAASLQSSCAWQLAFLEACAASESKPHVVFASTRLVYGRPEGLPVDETHPVSPQSFYAAHKLAVEHYHQIYSQRNDVSYTVARISNPFGVDRSPRPSTEYSFLNQLIRAAVEGRPLTIFGDGRQLRDYIYIEDLVDALALCGTHPMARNDVFNVGSGNGVSICEAARAVADLTGARLEFVPWPDGYIDVETGDYVSGIAKAEKLLGFRPRWTIRDGLTEAVASAREVRCAVRQDG